MTHTDNKTTRVETTATTIQPADSLLVQGALGCSAGALFAVLLVVGSWVSGGSMNGLLIGVVLVPIFIVGGFVLSLIALYQRRARAAITATVVNSLLLVFLLVIVWLLYTEPIVWK